MTQACGHPAKQPLDPQLSAQVLTHYADLAFAEYSDSAQAARVLELAVRKLVATPSAETLTAARTAWLLARVPYAQSEVFRFYDGPIDQLEVQINTWPIDENYVESNDPAAPGIIQAVETYPELSPQLLSELNAKQGETSISTGYHVIEFLLWGKDVRADGPGQRSHLDFVTSTEPTAKVAGDAPSKETLAKRRGQYLTIASELLVKQLEEVAEAWRPDQPRNYRSRFLALPPEQALGLAIKGMGTLSGPELSGERLTVAYETKDQENEHSCFSDNTQQDLWGNARGIQNVCRGQYVRSNGTPLRGQGLCQLIGKIDPAVAAQLEREIDASVTAIASIPAPFDRAILGRDDETGRVAVARSIRALQAQAVTLGRVGANLRPAL